MGRVFGEGEGHLGVLDGVVPLDGGHPGVPLEVAGRGEVGDVQLEVVLMFAGLALGAVNKDPIDFY